MYQTNKSNIIRKVVISMSKEQFIDFLYFILDKVDPNFYDEVNNSINNFIIKKVHYE